MSLILNQAYDRAAEELPPDADPAEYVVTNTGRAAAIVVLDEDGSVATSYQGERPVEAVLEVIGRT